ncbi:MAG: M20/M25/M40 family metallo-hydrolase [Chloroflexota bacterium]|nr:M20/M25/M40 family metallo-hydrolase [Chloroflexota bacterium]
MFDLKAHLKTLVEAHAPSGHEAPLRELVQSAWKGLVDSTEQDRLGSLIGIKRATQPPETRRKIMLAAHMDEIGMMVRDVVDGFVYVQRISGVDNRVMLAQTVMVHGRQPLPGIIATVPPHLLKNGNGNGKYPEFDSFVVDLGLPADEVARLVRMGDLITVDVPMIDLNSNRVAGKAMDDRACVAAVTLCLHLLQKMHHSWDVYAVATVQEESGLLGAKTSAYHIKPDIAIALDVTFAKQPGVPDDKAIEMNGGPGIGIGPNFHPKLYDKLRETARKHEIKLQDDLIPGASGTDAWAIQVALEGVPTALLEVPIRNMHSAVETADLRDIERCGRLLAAFIADLDKDFLTAIAWEDLKAQEATT